MSILHVEFYKEKRINFDKFAIGYQERCVKEDICVQERIKNIIEKNTSNDYSEILSQSDNWWEFYHLSDMRKSLFNWYDFNRDSNLLEIGGEFGALTDVFCMNCAHVTVMESVLLRAEAIYSRYKHINNLEVYAGEIENISIPEWEKKYDYIIINHVLETKGWGYSEKKPFVDYIKIILRYLKDDGKIFIVADNRFGIRNFCGARDKYTGKVFEGINRYPKGAKGYLFQRQELINILLEAGICEYKFYYPLPDANLPQLIYSDRYMEGGNVSERLSFYDVNKDTLIAVERALYKDIMENKALPFLANSFLVECATQKILSSADYAVLSTDRGRENGFATVVYDKKIVKKKSLYKAGYPNLKNIYNNITDLQNHGIRVIPHTLNDNVISMPYMVAEGLTEVLQKLVRIDKNKFIQIIDLLYQNILHSSEHVPSSCNTLLNGENADKDYGIILKTAYIDLVPANCFYKDGELWFYDQEFKKQYFPAQYVLYRGLKYTYMSMWEMEDYLPIKYFKDKYFMSDTWDIYEKVEKEFIENIRKRKVNHQFYEWEKIDEKSIQNRANLLIVDENEKLCCDKEEELRKMQEIQLDLLYKLKEICERFKLKYFAIYGTLLGVVRHGGIIPWDDDIDIAMPRKDYDKLIKIISGNLGDTYFLQTPTNDPECFYGGYCKLRNNYTTKIEMKNWGKNCNHGIALDIFPLDKCYLDKGKNAELERVITFTQRLILTKTYKNEDLTHDLSLDEWNIYRNIAKRYSKEELLENLYKLFTSINDEAADGVTIFARYLPKGRTVFRRECFENALIRRYELMDLAIPECYDEILKKCYGQYYMTYPSANHRKRNSSSFISTMTPYNKYTNRFWGYMDKLKNKKIIYVGTGALVDNFLYLYQNQFPPVFIVENRNENTPKTQWGYDIKEMNAIYTVPEAERKIIICSLDFSRYELQLNDMGITDYYIYVQDKWWILKPDKK